MNEQKGPLSGRLLILSAVAAISGLLASRLFILPELSIFLGMFAMSVFCGVQGMMITAAKPYIAFVPAVICYAFAAFAGEDALFAVLSVTVFLLAAALLALFTARKTPHHIVFTTLWVLFAVHILLVLALLIDRSYGTLSAANIKTAVDDVIDGYLSVFRGFFEKTASDPIFDKLPAMPEIDTLLDTLAFSIRANIINVICLLSLIPAAVSTVFYETAAHILGEDVSRQCFENREWLYLPPHALSHFFYLVYFGYVLFMFLDNETLFVAFGSLSFVLSLPLAYVGLRFAAWMLNTKIRSKGLVRLIVIGGAVLTTMLLGGLRMMTSLAAFFGAFVSLRTRIQKNNNSGGNE